MNGPATPPCGTGSVELSVGSDGNGAAQLRNVDYHGLDLINLTSLSYSTYVQVDGSGGQAPYLILNVDKDGNGTLDDLLFFEPVYQDATFFPSNPQPTLVDQTWQTWDARNGGWYAINAVTGAPTFGGPGTGVLPLNAYILANPFAQIVNTTMGRGGVRIVAGFGEGAWDNFVGNVDCFEIGEFDGSNVVTTKYDFELDSDDDGVPDDEDDCVPSDLRQFVDVNGNQPGVTSIPNVVDANGCSIQDHVNHCAEGAANHGQYVSCIAQLANDLRKAGVITNAQATEMKKGAAQSNVGK